MKLALKWVCSWRAAFCVLLSTIAVPATSLAHHQEVTRALFLEPSDHPVCPVVPAGEGDRARFSCTSSTAAASAGAKISPLLEVVVVLVIPGDRWLHGIADTNGDGRVGPDEVEVVKAKLLAEALDGLKLRIDGALAALDRVDARVQGLERPGAQVELMVYGQLRVPSGELSLSLEVDRTSRPVRLVLVGAARRFEVDRGFVNRPEGLVVEVKPGQRRTWRLGKGPGRSSG
ncbi:MAG: hypothetical protein H6729_00825 [Deltaproteobacteria bacterium]|nr:hypothetical protein [Deltaproteobacteria bacterium]